METSSREQVEHSQDTGNSSVVGVGRAWCRASRPTRRALGEGLREPRVRDSESHRGPELSIGTLPERDSETAGIGHKG